MTATTKSEPMRRGSLSPDDAERFASLFKPVWELDDAPFAAASPAALAPAELPHLGQAGIAVDVQLAHNGSFATGEPHAPAPAHEAAAPEVSIVVDLGPEPVAPPPTRPQVPRRAPVQAAPAQPAARPRRPIAPAARVHTDDELVPSKKSSVGLFVALGLVALLIVGAVAYKVFGGSTAETPIKPIPTDTTAHLEPRIPLPPPPVETTATTGTAATIETTAATATAATATAATAATTETTATTATVAVAPPTRTATAVAPPKPPPPVHTATAGVTKPPPKRPGGGIVRDNPF